MKRDELSKRVTEIFRDVFRDDSLNISDSTTADDIEMWDSLTHITLINDIEEAFNFRFSMNQVLGMKNVGELLDILEKV